MFFKKAKDHAPAPGYSTGGWAHYEKSRGDFFFVSGRYGMDEIRTHALLRGKEGDLQ